MPGCENTFTVKAVDQFRSKNILPQNVIAQYPFSTTRRIEGAAGMHEIVSLMLVAKAIQEQELDYLVIDTAPLTLEEIVAHMQQAITGGKSVARVHSGHGSGRPGGRVAQLGDADLARAAEEHSGPHAPWFWP